MELSEATETELLRELVARLSMSPAPIKTERHGAHFEGVIGIGKDDVAYIMYLNFENLFLITIKK